MSKNTAQVVNSGQCQTVSTTEFIHNRPRPSACQRTRTSYNWDVFHERMMTCERLSGERKRVKGKLNWQRNKFWTGGTGLATIVLQISNRNLANNNSTDGNGRRTEEIFTGGRNRWVGARCERCRWWPGRCRDACLILRVPEVVKRQHSAVVGHPTNPAHAHSPSQRRKGGARRRCLFAVVSMRLE
jgi:hypothetical protein